MFDSISQTRFSCSQILTRFGSSPCPTHFSSSLPKFLLPQTRCSSPKALQAAAAAGLPTLSRRIFGITKQSHSRSLSPTLSCLWTFSVSPQTVQIPAHVAPQTKLHGDCQKFMGYPNSWLWNASLFTQATALEKTSQSMEQRTFRKRPPKCQSEKEVRCKELIYENSGAESDLIELNRAQAIYTRSLVEEEAYWKQKARITWLQDGDRNTKLFNTAAKIKHSRLFIGKIKDPDGNWLDDPNKISQAAVEFFQNLLGPRLLEADSKQEQSILTHIPHLLNEEDNSILLCPMSLEEVKEATFLLNGDSAPGPNIFCGKFFHTCWNIISNDLFSAVREFFIGVPLPRGVGSSTIVLLPNKESPTTFADFRPISLCNFKALGEEQGRKNLGREEEK